VIEVYHNEYGSSTYRADRTGDGRLYENPIGRAYHRHLKAKSGSIQEMVYWHNIHAKGKPLYIRSFSKGKC
jgi:hypothetical protein